MIGEKFGRLVILSEVSSDVKGHRKFKCLCECGNSHIAILNNLKKGNTTQCKDCSSKQRSISGTTVDVKRNYPEYTSYRAMIDRCGHHDRYKHVQICDRWLHIDKGFLNFLEDMGKRPEGCTLDRIDNDKGYVKDNCRWATHSVQNHNKLKRKNAKLSNFIGVTVCKRSRRFVVQLVIDGVKYFASFDIELDAATYYDNLSEEFYGDRPNKTIRKDVTKNQRKNGGVSFDKKTNKFRVRCTVDGRRVSLGFYLDEDEAREVLEKFLDN